MNQYQRFNKLEIKLFILFLLTYVFLDMVTSIYCFYNVKYAVESSPVINFLGGYIGFVPSLFILKIMVIFSMVWVLSILENKYMRIIALSFGFIAGCLAVYCNLYVILR